MMLPQNETAGTKRTLNYSLIICELQALFVVCLIPKSMQSSKEEQRPVAPVTGDHDALFAGLPLIGGGESLGSAVTPAFATHKASRQPSGQQRSVIQ